MNDTHTNLQEVKDKIEQFVQDRNWPQFHSPKNLAMSVAIEAAELMEIFQWTSSDEAWNIKNNESEFIHLQEEMADVMIYCLSLANRLDIDMAVAIEDKIAKNEQKYPIKSQ